MCGLTRTKVDYRSFQYWRHCTMYSVVLMMAITGGGDVPAGLFDHGCGGGHGCISSCFAAVVATAASAAVTAAWAASTVASAAAAATAASAAVTAAPAAAAGTSSSRTRATVAAAPRSAAAAAAPRSTTAAAARPSATAAPAARRPDDYRSAVGGPGPGPEAGAKKTSIDGAAPATLVVNVPADARLTIDGEATTSTSTQRVFVSPN